MEIDIFSEVDKASASLRSAEALWRSSATHVAAEAVRSEWQRLSDLQTSPVLSALDHVAKQQRHLDLVQATLESPVLRAVREIEEQHAKLRRAADYSATSVVLQHEFERQQHWAALMRPSLVDEAWRTAQWASQYALPDALERYRTDTDILAKRLFTLQASAPWWQETRHLDAFVHASSMADALRHTALDQNIEQAMQAFSASPIPELSTLSQHRAFLDAAGLILPRWPRWRRLSRSEKRSRVGEKLRRYAPPAHVRKAQSLVHRHELALRDAIDWVMTDAFGEEWWIERLPACGCKTLLGRWKKRGGNVLDHADYAHYALIMCHPEHHAAGFDVGFPDRETLGRLLDDAGALRAASHHPRHETTRFTAEDLRQLRIIWGVIVEGLTFLEPDEDVEF
jgi:hypothetical protein